MEKIKMKSEGNRIFVTIEQQERKWYQKLFRWREPSPITGLTIDDFELSDSLISVVVDNGDGTYDISTQHKIELIH